MGIEFKVDNQYKYKDDIYKCLREHNSKFIHNHDSSTELIYVFQNEKLVGAAKLKLFWDWVGFDSIYYENIEILRNLLAYTGRFYKGKAEGIKTYVESEDKVTDLISVGFIIAGTSSSTSLIDKTFYLKTINFDVKSSIETTIEIYPKEVEKYNNIINSYLNTKDLHDELDNAKKRCIMIVALDEKVFIGGVCGYVAFDSLYVSELAVEESYRNKGVGRKLMILIEEEAYRMNLSRITLGTMDFQAPEFYKKLGFVVDFIKENDPKGFNSYSMSKRLSKSAK